MLSDRNKQLAKNMGKSTANYLIIFAILVALIGWGIGWVAGGWQDFVKFLLLPRDSMEFTAMKWAMAVWTALYVCANWFFLNILIRAYKRQKGIKWG